MNLAPQDYVNLGAARQARELGALDSLLVTDIDRGGAFAHSSAPGRCCRTTCADRSPASFSTSFAAMPRCSNPARAPAALTGVPLAA